MTAMTAEDVLSMASVLSSKITSRRHAVRTAVKYFRGEEGRLRFASEEFKQYFGTRFQGFSDNWCQPVAQAPIERIQYLGARIPQGSEDVYGVDKTLAEDWNRNDGDRGLAEALLMMTVARRSYGLVSRTDDGPRLTFENPDSAAVMYDGQSRRRIAGMLVWSDDTTEYAELLLKDTVLSLTRKKLDLFGGERVAAGITGWEFSSSTEKPTEYRHGLGVVPLVEFRNQSLLDNDPISDIGQVMPMQDAINLVWAYTLNSLDFMSLPGRVVLNGEIPKEDILDEHGEKVGERPMELDSLVRDRIAWLEGEGVSIAEWRPATVDGFSKIIEQAIGHVAAQTRTPSHYLISSSANVPAAGYELAEAGLVSKAIERISYANHPVMELSRLMAVARDDMQRAEAISKGRPIWKKAQYRSEAQLMDGLIKMRQAGFPFEWLAEEYGLGPEDVKRVMEMKRQEASDPTLEKVAAGLSLGSGV